MTTERDIVYERGDFWVRRDKEKYTVFRNGVTHATSDSAYAPTADGLSLACARVDYLAGRAKGKGGGDDAVG